MRRGLIGSADDNYQDDRDDAAYLDDDRYTGSTILTRRVAVPLDDRATGLNNNLMVFGPPPAPARRRASSGRTS